MAPIAAPREWAETSPALDDLIAFLGIIPEVGYEQHLIPERFEVTTLWV